MKSPYKGKQCVGRVLDFLSEVVGVGRAYDDDLMVVDWDNWGLCCRLPRPLSDWAPGHRESRVRRVEPTQSSRKL